MTPERTCAYRECKRPLKGKQLRFCSGRCRAMEWDAQHQRIRPKKYEGPICWCGKPAKWEEDGKPKCGNHHNARRREKEQWRNVLKEMQGNFSPEEAQAILWKAVRHRDSGGVLV